MPHTLVSSETVFNVVDLVVDVLEVPGLKPAVNLVEAIYKSVKGVKVYRGKCSDLAAYAVRVVNLINDHANRTTPTALQTTIDKTIETLEAIEREVEHWSQLSMWQSWYLRHDIKDGVEAHIIDLENCIKLLNLAGTLENHAITVDVRDRLEKMKISDEEDREILEKLENSLGRMETQFGELNKRLAEYPSGSSRRSEIQVELYNLRRDRTLTSDDPSLGIAPAELKGECAKVGSKAVHAGRLFDVWMGLWMGPQTVVALKEARNLRSDETESDRRQKERLKRQVDLWRTLSHTNVLTLHGWCSIDGGIFLVTPWLKHMDVMWYLRNYNPSDHDRLQITADIAEGLKYLHNLRIFHASIMPKNILINDEGQAVISDFSRSKAFGTEGAPLPISSLSDSDTRGMAYEAPEIRNEAGMTSAVDIFSWGMTSLEIISGAAPYHRYERSNSLRKAITDRNEFPAQADHDCPALSTTYPELWPLFEECWKADPAERPNTEHLGETLQKLLQASEYIPCNMPNSLL